MTPRASPVDDAGGKRDRSVSCQDLQVHSGKLGPGAAGGTSALPTAAAALPCQCGQLQRVLNPRYRVNHALCCGHDCQAGIPLQEIFGPFTTVNNTAGARGDPKPKPLGVGTMVAWLSGTMLRARSSGDYKRTPFFRADTGAPVVTPRVLDSAERARVMAIVRQA